MSTTFSLIRVLIADTAASTGPLPVAMAMRSWSPNFSTTVAVGTSVPVVTCRNLSDTDCCFMRSMSPTRYSRS